MVTETKRQKLKDRHPALGWNPIPTSARSIHVSLAVDVPSSSLFFFSFSPVSPHESSCASVICSNTRSTATRSRNGASRSLWSVALTHPTAAKAGTMRPIHWDSSRCSCFTLTPVPCRAPTSEVLSRWESTGCADGDGSPKASLQCWARSHT